MELDRNLELKRPMIRGEDVEAVQERLLDLGFDEVGRADSIFGGDTDSGVRQYQRSKGFTVNGIVDRRTWTTLFETAPSGADGNLDAAAAGDILDGVTVNHGIFGSVEWRLAEDGVRIADAAPETTGGRPVTVGRVWNAFGDSVSRWGAHYQVPIELIVATACTETGGNPEKIRIEPGFVSDEETPHRVSPGLMQTLISTARNTLRGQVDEPIDRAWLLVADNSIRAGTSYIGNQRRKTAHDPPKVACAYNAGSIVRNDGPENRWKMRQFPIGTSEHADRFVRWFNDCMRFIDERDDPPDNSFWRLLHDRG